MGCPFCDRIAAGPCIMERREAVAFPDAYPVTRGHALVVPRRHVTSLFHLDRAEQSAIWDVAAAVREKLRAELAPDGFTIGLNDGPAAGQTVEHAHVHVIPRYAGDVTDPRGGIRWVVPAKAAYWEQPDAI